jgi:hypothetical protein
VDSPYSKKRPSPHFHKAPTRSNEVRTYGNSELNTVFGLEEVDRWNSIRTSSIQPKSRPMRFLGFSNHEKGAPMEGISRWSTLCSTFSGSGWSVVRSASLAKGSTSKNRPSPHLHKVPTRNNDVSPRNLLTALVFDQYYSLKFNTISRRNYWEIIIVGLNVTNQILIMYLFLRHWWRNGSIKVQYISCL